MIKKISKEYIATFLPANPIVLEAGAHRGRDTKKMSCLWPQGTIHAFEPVPGLFEQLQKHTHECSNVYRYSNAIGNTTGVLPMHISSGTSTACSSLLTPKTCLNERPDIVFEQTIEVPVTTIDAWAKKQSIDTIDFMWLDLQGAELQALQGAVTILPSVTAILVEVNLTERYTNAPQYDQLKQWLANHGFQLHAQAMHHTTWGDALFLTSHLL